MYSSNFVRALAVIAGLHQARGQRDDNPIRDFDAEQLNEAMDDPDAVGEYSIPAPGGFDLSQPWPGTAQSGWKARVEIKADVKVTGSGYTTVTRIVYVPPESVEIMSNDTADFAPMDTSWYPCSNFWVSRQLTASSDDIDSSCSGILPSNCTSDILESLQEGFDGDFDSEWRGPHCPFTTLPDSCRETIGNDSRLSATEPSRSNTLDYLNLDAWYHWDDLDIHDKGDDAVYQEALARVWVVGTAWGFSRHSEYANGTDHPVNATLTCLHAREGDAARAGSDEDRNDDEDSGASWLSSSPWALVVATVAAGITALY